MKNILTLIAFTLFNIFAFGQTADDHYNAGVKKMEAENYDGAIADFSKAISMDAADPYNYFQRGLCKNMKDEKTGIEDLTKAIQLNPNFAEAYNLRAIAYSANERETEALKDYNKAVQLDPAAGEYVANRASTKIALKDYNGTVADCNKAIQLGVTTRDDIYYLRADARYELKDFKGALTDMNKALQLNATLADYYTFRGNIKEELNDHNGACADWKKANSMGANLGNEGCE